MTGRKASWIHLAGLALIVAVFFVLQRSATVAPADPGLLARLSLGIKLLPSSIYPILPILVGLSVGMPRARGGLTRHAAIMALLVTGVMLVGAAALASPALTVDLADGRVPDAGVLAAMKGFGTTLLLVVLLRVQALFVASTSTLALRTTAFSRWLSYLGYGIALAIFFLPMVSEPIGLAFPVWVGILSIALLVRRADILPSANVDDDEPGQ